MVEVGLEEGDQPLGGAAPGPSGGGPRRIPLPAAPLPLVEQRDGEAGLVPEAAEQRPLAHPAAAATSSMDTQADALLARRAPQPRRARARGCEPRRHARVAAPDRRGGRAPAEGLRNRTVVRYVPEARTGL
jgi:hypothetical protein